MSFGPPTLHTICLNNDPWWGGAYAGYHRCKRAQSGRPRCFDSSSDKCCRPALNNPGPILPLSNGFTNVLSGLFGQVALVHAARAEALRPLEPYGRGLVLSLAADHYLHRAFDAEEAVLFQ